MSLRRKRSDTEYLFSRLCEPCEALLGTPKGLRALMKKGPGGIRRKLNELTQSMKNGCSLCGLLLRSLERELTQIQPNESMDIAIEAMRSFTDMDDVSDYPLKRKLMGIETSVFTAPHNRPIKGMWIACYTTKGKNIWNGQCFGKLLTLL